MQEVTDPFTDAAPAGALDVTGAGADGAGAAVATRRTDAATLGGSPRTA